MAALIGTGTTVSFGTTSFSAEITGLSFDGVERAIIDNTHFGTTGARTAQVGDLYAPGTMTMDIHLNPNNLATPPWTTAAETVTVTFDVPSGSTAGATWAGSAAVSGFSSNVPLEDKDTASLVVSWLDDLTITAAS